VLVVDDDLDTAQSLTGDTATQLQETVEWIHQTVFEHSRVTPKRTR